MGLSVYVSVSLQIQSIWSIVPQAVIALHSFSVSHRHYRLAFFATAKRSLTFISLRLDGESEKTVHCTQFVAIQTEVKSSVLLSQHVAITTR